MKILKGIITLLLIGTLFSGCTEKSVESRLGDTVEIKYGNTAYITDGNLSIEFSGEVNDSRCPLKLDCFWPGEIEVWFKITQDGMAPAFADAILGVSDMVSKPAYYGDYKITLLEVIPYPIETNDIPDEIRVATIRVDKIDYSDTRGARIGVIHFSGNPPQDLIRDAFDLMGVSILDDTLTVFVRYGGGCVDHDFILYMDPPEFMESNPVQANLYLRHYGYDDPCDALVSDKAGFNIRAIGELYEEQYGQFDDIILNIYDYSLESFIRVTYSPN